MKRARGSVKKLFKRAKSAFKIQQTSASAAEETPIAADPIADRISKKKTAVSSVGTSTAGDISHGSSTVLNSTSHEQRTRAQIAKPAATAEAPVQPRINTEIINSDNADGHDADANAAPELLPVGSTTIRTHHLDSEAAEPSGSSNGLTADSGQTATKHMTAPVNGAPVIAQAVAPVATPVTASNAPPSELAAPAKSPHVQPRLVQQSSGAAIWHEALKTLQENKPETYKVLDKVLENVSTPKNDKVSRLFKLSESKESKPESKALLLRAKAILPSPATTRAVAMTIANVDPHKIAPFVVAGTFFIIDVLLNRLSPEDERKIRNMLFESVNAINEWISFETNFLKGKFAVEKYVQKLEAQLEAELPDLYNLALQLLCDLLTALYASWLETAGNKLSAAIVERQEQVEKLKDYRAKWTAKRKVMEEKLSRFNDNAKVLEWIKSADDPEQSLEALNDRATSEGRHKDSASWILDNQIFKAWSQNFYPSDPSVTKRVLWVSGSYGVGKTTIVHRVVSELQRLADGYLPSGIIQEEASKAKGLQVIPYFCDTSKHANYETIIRSIGRKLSFLPDFTIAQAAQKFYDKKTSGLTSTIYIKDYEDLVRSLLNERSKSYNIALLIDALNECDPPQNAERLCAFISEIVSKNPHVRVLFSSHEQLSGSDQLKDHLEKMEVVATVPGNELKHFVQTEIEFRKDKLKGSRSIFLNPQYNFLLEELQQSLIDGAKGMYVWVQVWLDITLPLQDDNKTVRLKLHAQELLSALQKSSTGASKANEQLQPGYQRLWAFGALEYFEEIRKRLFRFVLCAFEPLKLSTVAHALRIGIDDSEPSYQKEICIEDIDKLCSNFLQKGEFGHLSWTHDSARDFVVRVILNPGIDLAETGAETSMKSNHLSVANTFIAVMKDSAHPVWKELDLDPSELKLRKRRDPLKQRWKIEGFFWNVQSSLEYLGRHGWRHCQHAADEHVISDPLWTRVLRELILRPKTAFALWWRIWFTDSSNPGYRNLEEILGDYAGERIILVSHTLTFLNLKADSVRDVQPENAANAPPERSTEEDLIESLVRHAACKNLNGANGLHLACLANNGNILNLMLEAISHRHGGVARVLELLEEYYDSRTPFLWAYVRSLRSGGEWKHESQHGFDVMEILLRFENSCSRPNDCDQSSNRAPSLCLWSHQISGEDYSWGEGQTALMHALKWREEKEVIRLFGIHKPCKINVQSEYRQETALHVAATRGFFQLVKIFVEEYNCNATVDVSNSQGRTPLDDARDRLRDLLRNPPGTRGLSQKWFIERKSGLTKVIDYLESQSERGRTPLDVARGRLRVLLRDSPGT